MDRVEVRTLTDGGQPAEDTARALAAFVDGAERTLEIAIYDVHLPPPLEEIVHGAFARASARGVAVRLAYNVDHGKKIPVPPPPQGVPDAVEGLPVPTAAIPGVPDLMHHKYVVRDAASVWTGSTNWTADSWTREENVIVTVDSAALAARYLADFEQLWTTREVSRTGKVDTAPVDGMRAWFCPGRGEKLAHRIAKAIGSARRRVRIASPVLSSAPILATLAQVASDGKVDVAGVVDATQVREVLRQWHENGNAPWKEPLLRTALARAPFSGKESTPYAPGSVHDYMHAKVTVADDVAFVGSFNLSHSGEENAENVLELADPEVAERLAAFVDTVRARYPAVVLEPPRGG
ncbi:MAG TPA: phosphatidylserine/phosphatidylglycerophosphate/cardiolipin synthase family protein [Gaiellaceae bacterium]|nr:phosphatidylserine/phosphatidylglycerophosphate/cardiolipin synthase family protein [Gaiellaceae bacterium]